MKNIALILIMLILASFTNRSRPWFMPQPDGFIYVPTGTSMNEDNKLTSSSAFWMSSTEITNKEYRAFVMRQIDSEKYMPNKEVLDSHLWIANYSNYFTNPMFDNFPVVGLSKSQMIAYASWLGQKMRNEYPDWDYHFRLPTKSEWQFAAKGGRDGNDFPWGGPYARNSKGCALMHYFDIDQRFAVYGEEAPLNTTFAIEMPNDLRQKEYDKMLQVTKSLKKVKRKHIGKSLPLIGLPVPADSYFPNDYGLYGMSGNVAEMTSDEMVLGGSFRLASEYCKILGATTYPFDGKKPQSDIGFRLVCDYEGRGHDRDGNEIDIS